MTAADNGSLEAGEAEAGKLDSPMVAALYVDHADELRRFLLGLLRDPQLAADVLQMTFAKLIERGHDTRAESRKGWLFRVAYHEAMAVRRRQAVGERVVRNSAATGENRSPAAEEPLLKMETVAAVRRALDELPAEQQQVVRMRMYEEKTFAVIADELNIPLGTALGRMRTALGKLRHKLDHE